MTIATSTPNGPDVYESELPIRDDLAAAHREVASRWSRPGSWWTGEQRAEIVRQVRTARDHRTAEGTVLAPWVQPSSIEGLLDTSHTNGGPLPAAAIDAVWRLTNHPGTLTEDWYRSIIERGVDPLAYVELVGLVAQANCIDRFADALELPRIELDPPVDGPPSLEGPPAAHRFHWVPTADIRWPNVIKALSAVPPENDAMFLLSDAQYVPMEHVRGNVVADRNSLTRPQIEVVAARTSKLNECFY